jgi:multidrug transporter EmrE-like cation transporter
MRRILPMIFLIIFESVADIFAKKRSENQILRRAVGAIWFYIICNIFRLFALKNWSGLGRWAIIFSVASAVLAIFIWYFFFKEQFTIIQTIGIIFGITAIVLVSI